MLSVECRYLWWPIHGFKHCDDGRLSYDLFSPKRYHHGTLELMSVVCHVLVAREPDDMHAIECAIVLDEKGHLWAIDRRWTVQR
jgi:hypothetical protein